MKTVEIAIQNRRKLPRFKMELPLEVGAGDRFGGNTGTTRDVSAVGVYFFTQVKIQSGDVVDLVMTLPPEITLAKSLRVRCTSKIVRVEPSSKGIGAAAQIQRYEFMPSAEA